VPMKKGALKNVLFLSVGAFFGTSATVAAEQGNDEALSELEVEHLPAHQSAIDRRVALEQITRDNPFVITPHKPTYILPVHYDSHLSAPAEFPDDVELDPVEIKFQFSFKIELLDGLFDDTGNLSFGYTQQSFWQAYNSGISAPFRDTNYEPELMLGFLTNNKVLGLRNRVIRLGLVHQSNGQSGEISRSWNRLYADFIFERGDFYASLKPWWRIPESNDDNPDIEDYLGNFELRMLKFAGSQSYGVMLRNNLAAENRGAIELDWSFPLYRHLRGYVQYFNGYGESMLDYNQYSNSLGLGVMLTNWL
jgi:phospholipase A1